MPTCAVASLHLRIVRIYRYQPPIHMLRARLQSSITGATWLKANLPSTILHVTYYLGSSPMTCLMRMNGSSAATTQPPLDPYPYNLPLVLQKSNLTKQHTIIPLQFQRLTPMSNLVSGLNGHTKLLVTHSPPHQQFHPLKCRNPQPLRLSNS